MFGPEPDRPAPWAVAREGPVSIGSSGPHHVVAHTLSRAPVSDTAGGSTQTRTTGGTRRSHRTMTHRACVTAGRLIHLLAKATTAPSRVAVAALVSAMPRSPLTIASRPELAFAAAFDDRAKIVQLLRREIGRSDEMGQQRGQRAVAKRVRRVPKTMLDHRCPIDD